jgi:hypothetical protein
MYICVINKVKGAQERLENHFMGNPSPQSQVVVAQHQVIAVANPAPI